MIKNNRLTKKTFIALLASLCLASASSVLAYPTGNEKIKDKAIEIETNFSMLFKKDAPWSNVKVHANEGRLQVAGFVDDEIQRNKIATILDHHKKDYQVFNNTVIFKGSYSMSADVRLKDNIKNALQKEQFVLDDIDIQTRNGNVIISGFVEPDYDKRELINVISQVNGVKKVNNFLLEKIA